MDAYLNWILAATGFWVLDRLVRLVRLVRRNYSFSLSQGFTRSRATVNYVAPGLYEVSIQLSRDWDYVEGQYVFLHLPSGLNWMQSHPFTILDYSQSNVSDARSVMSEDAPALLDRPKLRILLRARAGLTSTLPKLAAQGKVPVLVEGPYGHSKPLPLERFDNITFIAGGVGFAAVFSHAKRAAAVAAATTSVHHNLHFILVLRTHDEYHGFLTYLEELDACVKVSVYLTSKQNMVESQQPDNPVGCSITVETGHRPQLDYLIRRDSENAGSLAVVVCGP